MDDAHSTHRLILHQRLDSHNQLEVTRQGSQIRLYVNGHYLTGYSDSTYTGTRIMKEHR